MNINNCKYSCRQQTLPPFGLGLGVEPCCLMYKVCAAVQVVLHVQWDALKTSTQFLFCLEVSLFLPCASMSWPASDPLPFTLCSPSLAGTVT